MKSLALSIALWGALVLPGCGGLDPKEAAAREWQRSECNRVVDREDRERCLKRVDG
ncbi:MAG: hypothetical protein ACXWG1_19355 [Usitatibacter sp.]